MDNTSDLKVAKSSRSAIDSISNSKEEFSSLITKMDNEIEALSQEVRITNGVSSNDKIGRVNKLKIHRRSLHEMLMKMETMPEDAWETIRPAAQKIYEEAAAVRQ